MHKHTETRPAVCPVCGKEFAAKWNVSQAHFQIFCSCECNRKRRKPSLETDKLFKIQTEYRQKEYNLKSESGMKKRRGKNVYND